MSAARNMPPTLLNLDSKVCELHADLAAERSVEKPLVSVVIPSFNRADFLPEAIESVFQQTYSHYEILVVDDGSTDNTAEVAQTYPVQYYYQNNAGVCVARNNGLLAAKGDLIVFLDSDDRLFPHALESGVRALTQNPDCMMATGDFAFISANGTWMRPSGKPFIKAKQYERLLRSNFIEMTSTCIFRREVFDSVGLFNPALTAAEDYDLYLRVARQFPVVCYPTVVAEYRFHGQGASRNAERALQETMRVVDALEQHVGDDPAYQRAYRTGRGVWRRQYGRNLAQQLATQPALRKKGFLGRLSLLARHYPPGLLVFLARWAFPNQVNRFLRERELRRAGWVPPGRIDFGSLRSQVPIGRLFDLNRGTSIHSFYCGRFLSTCARDIRGSVLHIGEANSQARAGESVGAVLDRLRLASFTAMEGDTFRDKSLESDAFDCILITDSLEYIPNLDVVMARVKRLLKPGGVVLAVLPGLQSGHRQRGISNLHWHFTSHSAGNLFERFFGRDNIEVVSFGNVLTATAALHGLAAEELTTEELESHDPAYEVSIFIRAVNIE